MQNKTQSEPPPVHGGSTARSHAWLFHVFSCDTPLVSPVAACNLDDVDEVEIGRNDAGASAVLTAGRRRLKLGFLDRLMSARHARIERRGAGFWVIDEGSKNGLRLNGDRIDDALLADGDWIQAGHTLLRYRHGALPPSRRRQAARVGGMAGATTMLPWLEDQLCELEDVARSPIPVMLRGETGTGKEVAARAVHELSGRPGKFIAVNCGAIPAALVESELFGHVNGAFTGAVGDRPGLVRASDRGTLFLDEVGDLLQPAQGALLRVLQEHEVTPVGATRPIKVDLRVVSATHRDLEAQVAQDRFRADLFARLRGYPFTIPPLRERREDLGLLIAALLRRVAPEDHLRFAPEAARALCAYDWPLNVRELEQWLGSVAARVRARDGVIGPDHVPAVSSTALTGAPIKAREIRRLNRCAQVEDALRRNHGNISAAARDMNKARNQLQRWIKDCGLDPERYRRP